MTLPQPSTGPRPQDGLLAPSPRTRYWRRRALRHLWLALLSAGLVMLVARLSHSPQGPLFPWSMGTAYASLALLAASLAIGPANVLRRRPNPVSSDLRRDIGIWAALLGIAHTVLGLQVHMGGRLWLYFMPPPAEAGRLPIRTDLFGLANYTGLGAALLLAGLLTISNDFALRRLGIKRWKGLQRGTYFVLVLTIAHGAVYQLLERRAGGYVLAFASLVAVTIAAQVLGYRRERRRRTKGTG